MKLRLLFFMFTSFIFGSAYSTELNYHQKAAVIDKYVESLSEYLNPLKLENVSIKLHHLNDDGKFESDILKIIFTTYNQSLKVGNLELSHNLENLILDYQLTISPLYSNKRQRLSNSGFIPVVDPGESDVSYGEVMREVPNSYGFAAREADREIGEVQSEYRGAFGAGAAAIGYGIGGPAGAAIGGFISGHDFGEKD
jgi:hypothetical protein